jgi:hypothetical protein
MHVIVLISKPIDSEVKMTPNPIDELLQRIEEILLRTWDETGYGSLPVESKRLNDKKIEVMLRGSPHYRFVVRREDVQRWRERQEVKDS